MKRLILPLLTFAVLGAFNSASADTVLRSPRASDQNVQVTPEVKSQSRAIGGRTDRPVLIASPRAAEQMAQRHIRAGNSSTIARTTGPIGPRFQSPRAAEHFYVAPLK